MRILRVAENKAMPWKNGDGTTYEIAVSPAKGAGSGFDWRISRALLTKPGPFSIFPGIDRNLSVLSGELLLVREDGTQIDLKPTSMPFAFAGEAQISGSPKGGSPVVDFNVMTRRGCWFGSVNRMDVVEYLILPESSDVTAVFVESGALNVEGQAGASIGALDCVLFEKGEAGTIVAANDTTRILVAELRRIR